MNAMSRLLLGGTLDREVLLGAERSTLMLVDDPLRQYSSFFMRPLAATVVATAGIASDSATTIIGAMLIAPLMSPMLGTALAAAMGRPRQALRTLALVILGMALVVLASACVTALIPVAADMETNSQVGAQARQIWYAFVALAMVVVVGLLFSTSMDVLDVTQRERQVQDVTSAWLEETGYRVEGLEVDGEDVYVRIAGSGDAPDAQLLCDRLAEKGVGVESVSVSVLEERRVTGGK